MLETYLLDPPLREPKFQSVREALAAANVY